VYGVYKTVVRGNGDGFAAYFEPQHDGRPYRRTIGNFTTLEFAQQGCQQDFNNIVAMHGEPRSYAASLERRPDGWNKRTTSAIAYSIRTSRSPPRRPQMAALVPLAALRARSKHGGSVGAAKASAWYS
jgi:hypothetical protein